MLGLIDVFYKSEVKNTSSYFIYDLTGNPYLIDKEEQKWLINPVINKTAYRGGAYFENNDTYYLIYEEPCFYE